jgi:hypothetical protein
MFHGVKMFHDFVILGFIFERVSIYLLGQYPKIILIQKQSFLFLFSFFEQEKMKTEKMDDTCINKFLYAKANMENKIRGRRIYK